MRSIAFFNNKGGVGKTTLLCNVAASLARKSFKRVLVVDADPQCNATSYVIGENAIEKLYSKESRMTVDAYLDSVSRGKGYKEDLETVRSGGRFGFDIIPGDPKLALREDFLASDWKDATAGDERGLKSNFVFKGLLQQCKNYDYVFFDVGPSLGALNRSVLLSCDYFLMPMTADVFSVMAIKNIGESLKSWRRKLDRGLEDYADEYGHDYLLDGQKVGLKIQYMGYVSQQYKSKTQQGVEQPVKAYERILKKINPAVSLSLKQWAAEKLDLKNPQIGKVKNLHSLVPLSQSANCPVFELTGDDGVVGGHFASVKAADDIFAQVASEIERITE
ncbi:nitrogenase iron protein [Rubritalea halochordaticola]|uniref:Nitrogenase iron protein n=1 Tax=Rubritalea halochordaticola TaxID=714537 RepID=A0ABP9V1A7_9BACT